MSEKLTSNDKSFLHLILRSPDIGEGWRSVSATLMRLVLKFPHQELIETTTNAVRLTERGKMVADYL